MRSVPRKSLDFVLSQLESVLSLRLQFGLEDMRFVIVLGLRLELMGFVREVVTNSTCRNHVAELPLLGNALW